MQPSNEPGGISSTGHHLNTMQLGPEQSVHAGPVEHYATKLRYLNKNIIPHLVIFSSNDASVLHSSLELIFLFEVHPDDECLHLFVRMYCTLYNVHMYCKCTVH